MAIFYANKYGPIKPYLMVAQLSIAWRYIYRYKFIDLPTYQYL